MLIDAREIPAGKTVETDLCIIGSGAAGLTLAREFAGQKTSVCLLESGGFTLEGATQALNQGETAGTFLAEGGDYLMTSRLRLFGGTTFTWAGWCVPLDPIDFEARDWIPNSGWPFTRADLEPYYQRAYPVCQIQPVESRLDRWRQSPRPPLDLGAGAGVITKLIHMSPPTRFGKVYGSQITGAPNIDTYHHASVLELVPGESGKNVTTAVVSSLRGNHFRIRAGTYVLAAGGIENARILLLSRGGSAAGLGNDRDLVGRYFLEHPHLHVGFVLFTGPAAPMELYREHSQDPLLGHESMGVLCLSDELLRRERLVNMGVQLYEAPAERLSPFVQDVGRMATRVDSSFTAPLGPPSFQANLYARTEGAPNPDSRVTLTGERDALGQERVRLDWRLRDEDNRSVRRTLETFARELGRLGRGRIHVRINEKNPWPGAVGGDHHGGTTRMHVDRSQGVVNADARLHDVENLFVAGNSVFPTSGFANPTLTLVALTLRLADHLKGRLAADG